MAVAHFGPGPTPECVEANGSPLALWITNSTAGT
jgi:hypothetical protein